MVVIKKSDVAGIPNTDDLVVAPQYVFAMEGHLEVSIPKSTDYHGTVQWAAEY